MSRRSPAHTLALFLVLVLAIRLALSAIDLAARLAVWWLLRVCWALEWCIARLRTEHDRSGAMIVTATRQTPVLPRLPARRVDDSGRTPVPTAYRELAHAPAADHDDVTKFMKLLGTKDRAEAERLMALGTRVPAR